MNEAHYKMFCDIREYHKESSELRNAVSAVIFVALMDDGDNGKNVKETLFLVRGVWYGSGSTAVTNHKNCMGCKVSVVPILSPEMADWLDGISDPDCVGVNSPILITGNTGSDDLVEITIRQSKSDSENPPQKRQRQTNTQNQKAKTVQEAQVSCKK